MNIYKVIVIAVLLLNPVVVVAIIDKPRPTATPSAAAVTLVVNALLVLCVVLA